VATAGGKRKLVKGKKLKENKGGKQLDEPKRDLRLSFNNKATNSSWSTQGDGLKGTNVRHNRGIPGKAQVSRIWEKKGTLGKITLHEIPNPIARELTLPARRSLGGEI